MAEQITNSNFDEILSNNALVAIDFGASWCGPCRMLAPIVEKLAEEYAGRVFIGKADVEEADEITEKFSIRSVPTVLFFKNGELLPDKIVGAVPESKLREKIEAMF